MEAAEVEAAAAAAALVIQSFIRMRLARSSHLNKTFISTRLAALCRSKIQRENYIQFRSSVISLQSSHRARLAAAEAAAAQEFFLRAAKEEMELRAQVSFFVIDTSKKILEKIFLKSNLTKTTDGIDLSSPNVVNVISILST